MASQMQQSSQNRSYYPVDLNPLLENFTGNIGAATGNINNFLNNPLDSSMFKNTIGSILSALGPSEDAARTAVADQFRMAGGGQGGALQSGAFSNAVKQNERNILDQRGRVVAQNASQTFRDILGGLGLQLNAAEAPTRLIGSIRPLSEGSSQGSSSSWDDGGGSGSSSSSSFRGVGGGGGFLSTPNLGYTPGIGLPNSYGASPGITGPNYDPVEEYYNNQRLNPSNFAGFGGAATDASGRPIYSGGRDEFGYTAQDWQSDPFYNN